MFFITIGKGCENIQLKVCAETVKICATASEYMLKQMCGCFWKHFMFFKERAAASESKCATASKHIF